MLGMSNYKRGIKSSKEFVAVTPQGIPMKALEVFETSHKRVEHLLKLHELLHNRRRRRMRADWARRFKTLMHWRQSEAIDRVDGHRAIVILREGAQLTAAQFHEEYLNDLLRAALASSVGALDRYCHELILSHIVPALKRPSVEWPKTLQRLRLPMPAVKAAVLHASKPKSRPMNVVRDAVRELLHRDFTLQRPDEIERALSMIGMSKLWIKTLKRKPSLASNTKELKRHLNLIVTRRNRIVHEGDIKRKKRGGKVEFHSIGREEIAGEVQWVSELIRVIDAVTRGK